MENTKFLQKNAKKFECLLCDFYTSNKTNLNIHLQTEKHKQRTIIQNNTDFVQKNATFKCECGKFYKHKPNLYAHKKKCQYQQNQLSIINQQNQEEKIDYNKIIHELINQNNTLQNTIKELIPKIGNNNNINNNSNNNSNNNTTNNQNFNICLFLDEKFPDAITIEQFVKQIEVSIKDLFFTKQNGIVNGVSNIFIENLNKLPLVQRPLWCADKKRKKIYVKGDKWTEDIENQKTKKTINDISFIQTKNINQFIQKNPNWMQNEKLKEQYISIVKQTTQSIHNKQDYVIKQIIQSIQLDKNNISKEK